MKKIALYILLSLVINYSLGIAAVSANTNLNGQSFDTSNLIASNDDEPKREYQPPLIYKPKTLPGPTQEEQAAVSEADGSKASATQRILTDILLPKAATGFIGFITMASFLMLVIAGVRFVVAYGNEEDITKAKNQTIYAIVGLIIALLSYTIVAIIANLDLTTTSP